MSRHPLRQNSSSELWRTKIDLWQTRPLKPREDMLIFHLRCSNIIVFLFCFAFLLDRLKHADYSILFLVCNHVTRRPCWGVNTIEIYMKIESKFPDDRITFILVHQHGCREDMCKLGKPAIELTIYLITDAIYHPNYEMNYRTLTRQSPISR